MEKHIMIPKNLIWPQQPVWKRDKLQQQANQEMALDESSTTTKLYPLEFYPQDKLLKPKQGKEMVLGSVEKYVGFLP